MSKKCTRCGLDVEREEIAREELSECPRCGESLAVAQVRDLAEAAAKSTEDTVRLSRKGPRKGQEPSQPDKDKETPAGLGGKEADTTEDMPPRHREAACDPPEGE